MPTLASPQEAGRCWQQAGGIAHSGDTATKRSRGPSEGTGRVLRERSTSPVARL